MSAIWLASWPRSGNTWARFALLTMRRSGARLRELQGFGQSVTTGEALEHWLEIEAGDLTPAEVTALRPGLHAAFFAGRPPEPCKIHDRWLPEVFAPAFTHATLYFIRDPRDVAVSWARFTGCSLDRAIAFLDDPEAALGSSARDGAGALHQPIGRWSSHAQSWIDESGLAPLVVRYEDMLADPANVFADMAAHLGWSVDAEAIARTVEATRFDRMADEERREGFFDRTDATDRFFAGGRAGGWRDTLSADQALSIVRAHGEVMARFGYL
jgi:hypothetical protein